uniref:Uncharacterized protein n=1 Tax=Oryza sativa subsp. japonica TaxID=39947 RepID=Q2R2C1_ORYSJ|nr:hypothetical protein LOC_Os11g36320 [Oryza sativa Japonica Group]
MGSRDGFSNKKLLDDFGYGEIQPVQVHLPTRSEPSSSSTTWSIEIIQASRYAAYQRMSDHMMSNEYAIATKEQLSTRVGCGQVHCIIENGLDKCRVVAPNLPTKTDDLSHSTGHGWTTREKYVAISHTATSIGVRRARWFSNQYVAISHTATSIGVRRDVSTRSLVLEPYVAISRTATSIGDREMILLARWFSNQYVAISPTTTSIGDREMILLACWFSNQYVAISRTATSIGVREIILLARWFSNQNVAISRTATSDGRGTQYRQVFYPEIPYHKRHLALKPILMSLYAVLTKPLRNLRELRLGTPRADKALSDPSETKDHERHRAVSDLARHELEEEDYPGIDYESDLQTAMSTTVR